MKLVCSNGKRIKLINVIMKIFNLLLGLKIVSNFFIKNENDIMIYGIKVNTQLNRYEFIVLFVKLNINSGINVKKFQYSPDQVLPRKLFIPSISPLLKLTPVNVCKL